jgi:hypothetical protein
MNPLSVGSPDIIVIDLLRVKPNVIKKRKREGTKKEMDMGKLVGVGLGLDLVAKLTGHPMG